MICVLFNIKKCRMELLMLQNLWPTLYIAIIGDTDDRYVSKPLL